MNFLLSNLEVALEEQHLLVGEKLFEENKVNNLYEGQRNLWVAEVDQFEVELQISPSRVKAVSCECDVFLKNKMCGHVAAGLFALRRHFVDLKTQKKKSTKKKSKVYKKLTTSAILENVSAEELKAFVGKYAKQNRNFALALNTRFASSVPLSDNHVKYQQILSQLLQGIRKKNNMVSANGLKQFLATCNELLNQAKDAFVLKHFTETWAISHSLIQALPLVIRSSESGSDELLELVKDIFSQIDQLTSHPIPPELKTEIWEAFIYDAPKKSFRTADLAIFFLRRLPTLADDKAKKNLLLETLVENWKYRSLISDAHALAILRAKIPLLASNIKSKSNKEFVSRLMDSFPDFNLAIKASQKIGQFKYAHQLIEKGKDNFTSKLFQSEIESIVFQLAVAEGDKKSIIKIGEELFLKTGDLKMLNNCREHYRGKWEKKIADIIKKVKKLPLSRANDILPRLYAAENLIEELQDFLLNKNSIELAMQYDLHFIPGNKEELSILYRALLDDYLSSHFGEKPSRYILKILNHLRKIGGDNVAENVVAFIRKKYPRRMELAIEMMGI